MVTRKKNPERNETISRVIVVGNNNNSKGYLLQLRIGSGIHSSAASAGLGEAEANSGR